MRHPISRVTRSRVMDGDSRGFTLVELMVMLTVLAVVMVALMAILFGAAHNKTTTTNRIQSTQAARTALDMMAGDMRSAGYHADLYTYSATPQPSIAYIDSQEVILSGDFGTQAAYDPAGTPNPRELVGTTFTPAYKYTTGAELIRWTLDVNNDGTVDGNDQGDATISDAQITRNPNDYVLVRQVYGDATGNSGNNGGQAQSVALVSKPGSPVPPMFTVYLQGSNTPYSWSSGPVPASQLSRIERVVISVTAPSPSPDGRGHYVSTTMSTTVNSMRNVPNTGVTTYQINGRVFDDLNINGSIDTGESGIPGVSVRLGSTYTSTTDATGNFVFRSPAGTYTIRHTPLSGYGNRTVPDSFVVTVPPAPATTYTFADTSRQGGWVHMNAYEDLDLDHFWDSGEPGAGGVTMSVSGVSVLPVTNIAGACSLFVSPGSFSVTAAPPDSFIVTTTNPVSATMTNGGSVTATFALRKSLTGIVTGKVYSDLNRSGSWDSGEGGKQGIWVGVLADDGATVLGFAYSDASGNYSIVVPINNPPHTGAYSVFVIIPSGNYPTSATAIGNLWVAQNQTLSNNNFGVDPFQRIQLTAARVLSLASADVMEKDWSGNATGNRAGDTDILLGADASGTDQISVWFNQYNATTLFNPSPSYTRTAGASVLAIATDSLDTGAATFQTQRPDIVTGTKWVAAGNFQVWLDGNASGSEGNLPTLPTATYKTTDKGDVQAVLVADFCGASAAPDAKDILVGTKSPTANTGTLELWQSSGGATPTYSHLETYPAVGASYVLGEVTGMTRADFDGDGKPDLVVVGRTGTYSGKVTFYKYMGKTASPRFQFMASYSLDGDAPTGVVTLDMNGDDYPDVVIGTQNAVNSGHLIYGRNKDAAGFLFAIAKTVTVGGPVQTILATDLGGSTRPDIAVGWRTNDTAYTGGVLLYFTDVGTLTDSGTDPSGGLITDWCAALCGGNFNYGIRPAWSGAILQDFAAGTKSGVSSGSLWVFIR